MAKSTIKHNLPHSYKDRDDLVSQVIDYIDLKNTWKTIKTKPSNLKEWALFLFQKNGWQLSYYGNILFRSTFYSYKIEHIDHTQLTGKIIINLNKLLESPWCHKDKCLYMWNQPRWFELQMFDGDLKRYINSYT